MRNCAEHKAGRDCPVHGPLKRMPIHTRLLMVAETLDNLRPACNTLVSLDIMTEIAILKQIAGELEGLIPWPEDAHLATPKEE